MTDFLDAKPESPVGIVLEDLRKHLDDVSFPLALPSAAAGADTQADIVHQLDDYMLPRYASLDAPLLAVVGGSTGSGKSTLVNAIIRAHVSRSSAIRPTTRRPFLIHHPEDTPWFTDQRILPGLARVMGSTAADDVTSELAHTELAVATSTTLPAGIALLDSPDIDSVVEENRRLAAQLLGAADLWIFVTTAARYADAIPWALLDEAASRNIVVAVVLNRVPTGVGMEVRQDLSRRLAERGLGHAPLFVVSETSFDDDGFIPDVDVASIRGWLAGIAQDAAARSAVARQTLAGAVDQLLGAGDTLKVSMADQSAAVDALRWDVESAFSEAMKRIMAQLEDGTLLRGEVLSRWQDVVGAGEWTRQLESGVSKLRDKIAAFFTSRPPSTDKVETAIEEGVHALLVGEAEAAIAEVEDAWARFGGTNELLAGASLPLRSHDERIVAAGEVVRAWQNGLLETIREESAGKKSTARFLSFGVNALGVALMIVIFASTAGLTGGEVAVAGGTAVVAQKVLEAVFGDDAVRRMTKRAKDDLNNLADKFLRADSLPFASALGELGVGAYPAVEDDFAALAKARSKEARKW